jgi:hypothetical protein
MTILALIKHLPFPPELLRLRLNCGVAVEVAVTSAAGIMGLLAVLAGMQLEHSQLLLDKQLP